MIKLDGTYPDKESFHEWILSCCDTLVRNEDKLYNITRDYTRAVDITFPIRVDEVATMIIEIEKVVQNYDEKIVVIKNLEDKENEENEIKDELKK